MDMYRQEIMDHFKNPRNEGKMDDADVVHEENNPLCGDVVTVYIKKDSDRLEEMKYTVEGCAISKASMSMLSEKISGMTKSEICSLGLDEIKKILGIPLSSSREKCAMIGLEGIKKAIEC